MKQLLALSLFAIALTFSSCGPRVYTAPNAASATVAHSVVAIIPPVVTIYGRPNEDPEALARAANDDVFTFQQEMYSWMLRRKQQGRIRGVEILDLETTNAKLNNAGFFDDEFALTPAELANTLGVDAVITSNFNTTKPMSEGVAVALGVLFNTWGNTKETTANLRLHDPNEGVIWNYDWVAGGTFASSEALVNDLMRNASRRMPYVAR